MSLILTPAQFVKQSTIKIANCDIKKALAKFEENGKNFLALGTFKSDKTNIRTMLKGELISDGISSIEFNRVPSYSLGIRLENDEDLEAFEEFNNILSSTLAEAGCEDLLKWLRGKNAFILRTWKEMKGRYWLSEGKRRSSSRCTWPWSTG